MVELRILGPTSLRGATGDEVLSVLAQPKRMALLSYLAVADPGAFQRRDRLLALFWPHLDEKKARAALSVALHHLKRALGPDTVVTRGADEIGLDVGEFWCDAIAFLGAVADDDLLRAADLYQGTLLDGFHLDGASDFEQWMDGLRERLRGKAVDVVGRLADEAAAAGDDAATVWARRALEVAPYDDSSAQRMMSLLVRSGHRAEAVTVFRGFARRLEADLDLEPSQQTQELVARIRAGERFETASGVAAGLDEGDHSVPTDDGAWAASSVTDGPRRWSRVGAGLAIGVPVLALTLFLGSRLAGPVGTEPVPDSPAVATVEPELRLLVTPPVNRSGDAQWDYLGQRLNDEMRRAIDLHEGSVDVVAASIVEGAVGAYAKEGIVDVLMLGRSVGATRAIASRYTLGSGTVTLTLEVLNVTTSESLRTLDPVRGALDSDSLVTKAGDAAAVAAMYLRWEPGNCSLRFSNLPRRPITQRSFENGKIAFDEQRWEDALDWALETIALEPDWVQGYVGLRVTLSNLGRSNEFQPFESTFEALRPTLTQTGQLITLWQEGGPSFGERIFRLQDGDCGSAYMMALSAIAGNRLYLAREGMDAFNFEHPRDRDWTLAWMLDDLINHMIGDYSSELARARDGIARFAPNPRLSRDEARALVGLDSISAAMKAFDDLVTSTLDQATRWQLMHEVALEFRRHGHIEASEAAFGELLRLFEHEPEINRFQRAQTYYGAAMYEQAIPLFEAELEEREGFGRMAPAALLMMSLEALGRRSEAERYGPILEDFPPDSRNRNRRWAAAVAASRGDAEGAVRILREAFGAGAFYYRVFTYFDPSFTFMHIRPEFEPIRELPLFVQLMTPTN